MKKTYIFLIVLCVVALSCDRKRKSDVERKAEINWSQAKNNYLHALQESISYLDTINKLGLKGKNIKENFIKSRIAFKKAEPFASYLNPKVGHKANGPALPIFKGDNNRVLSAIGLQKIEESIYEGEDSIVFKTEVSRTIGLMKILENNIKSRDLTPERFFIATQQQLLRIITHSITGFDTPVSNLGLNEAATSLQNLYDIYQLTIQDRVSVKNGTLDNNFKSHINSAINYLLKNKDNFVNFDRYIFIKDYFNPITTDWKTIREVSGLWKSTVITPFNFDANTFFERNSFNLTYFTPGINRNPSRDKIALGKKLFFEPNLSKDGTMSCATCHVPNKAYTDGLATAINNHGGHQMRNTPTLINVAYQKSFFADGRSETILNQITSVFLNKDEFNSQVHQFSDRLLKDSSYVIEFRNVFGEIPKNNTAIINSLGAYISSLNGFNSRFDRNITGKQDDFTEEEKLGFNLFSGRALCATCHFLPLTNGTVPPFFNETEKEVIGVPNTSANKEIDNDLGFYWRYKNKLHQGMFKTPTVRNSAVTAPYMHNGIYTTLEQVVDFYNKGGGAGLGFNLPHQTLPFDNLELSKKEQDAIVAFLKSLTDTQVDQY